MTLGGEKGRLFLPAWQPAMAQMPFVRCQTFLEDVNCEANTLGERLMVSYSSL